MRNDEAVLSELRENGPGTLAEIQARLRLTKRETEHAIWKLSSQAKVDYDYPMTAPPTYRAL